MAREAVLIVQKTIPEMMTVANGTGIEKGTLLVLSDPNTAAASTATNDKPAGIAYGEKIASDGKTKLEVLSGPGDIVKVTASGAITVGNPVGYAVPGNYVRDLTTVGATSGSFRFGFARETAADGDTLLVELNRGYFGNFVS